MAARGLPAGSEDLPHVPPPRARLAHPAWQRGWQLGSAAACPPSCLPSICWPGWMKMQGQQELQGESLCDAREPGEVSLHQVAGGQSGDSLERKGTYNNNQLLNGTACSCGEEDLPSCTVEGADPGELSGAWGEFKGFQESSAKFEQFSQSPEVLQSPAEPQWWRTLPAPREHCLQQSHQDRPWVTGTAVDPSPEVFLQCLSPVQWAVCFPPKVLQISCRL